MLILKVALTVVYVLVCGLLMVVILLQASRGGGLSGTFGGSQSSALFGARGTASALTSATQYLAGGFLVLSLVLSLMSGTGGQVESVTQRVFDETPAAALPPVEGLEFGQEGGATSTASDAAAEPLDLSAESEEGE